MGKDNKPNVNTIILAILTIGIVPWMTWTSNKLVNIGENVAALTQSQTDLKEHIAAQDRSMAALRAEIADLERGTVRTTR